MHSIQLSIFCPCKRLPRSESVLRGDYSQEAFAESTMLRACAAASASSHEKILSCPLARTLSAKAGSLSECYLQVGRGIMAFLEHRPRCCSNSAAFGDITYTTTVSNLLQGDNTALFNPLTQRQAQRERKKKRSSCRRINTSGDTVHHNSYTTRSSVVVLMNDD